MPLIYAEEYETPLLGEICWNEPEDVLGQGGECRTVRRQPPRLYVSLG